MSRTGENIYKRKDGRWEGRYIKEREISGKAVYGYVYAKSYRDVKEKLTQVKTSSEKTKSPYFIHEKKDNTFYAVASEWLNTVRSQIKESTYRKYDNMLSSYILPVFGKIQLEQLSDSYLQNFRDRLLKAGGSKKKGLSSKTVSDVLSVVKNILQFAADKGYFLLFDGKSVSVKQNPSPMRVLSLQEQQALCQYLINDFNTYNRGIMLCLFTGIRIGELCALKWEDISLTEKTIYIHSTMQRIQNSAGMTPKTKIIVTTPKSKCSIRHIPLHDELVRLLSFDSSIHSGYFLTNSEEKYVEPRTMQYRFKIALKKSSIAYINFHSLRHTFATRCIENGFDVKSLSEILGHANVNITMNRYVHPSMELKRENMRKLSSLFSVE